MIENYNSFHQFIQVSFIDYGSRDIVNISKMRHLTQQFQKTAKAAVCCALGNIKPIGKAFSTASADTLINLVDGEKMWARIFKIDTDVSRFNI